MTAEVTGRQDADGAYVGSATVTVAAQDEGSGVASIEVDAHGGHWMPYTTPVAITEPGEHTVSYRATDAAGNVSEVGATTFTVVAGDGEQDTTAPR
ncbi:Ig-like domain-containing protein [Oerskovia sp. M15]